MHEYCCTAYGIWYPGNAKGIPCEIDGRWQDIRPSRLVFCSLQLNLTYMKEGQFFLCVGDLIYTRLQRCFLPHAHGTFFFLYFLSLWKSIEESNLCVWMYYKLHVIWTIWNHSLVEVRRLMPYIIHQVWRCQICCLSSLRLLEILIF